MKIAFTKYQGAGNDFIIVDNRNGDLKLTTTQIAFLCDRRFGIGADGLMFVEKSSTASFRMVYYNADGRESTMCGNGGRCIAAFAHDRHIAGTTMHFDAVDGVHEARILEGTTIALHMQDVNEIQVFDNYTFLNTGSPHVVMEVQNIETYNVFQKGRDIRYSDSFVNIGGTNVNFIERRDDDVIQIRTYERGVEDETLACGTGVTAAAIMSVGDAIGDFDIPVQARGGLLSVQFSKTNADKAHGIILSGPATKVFEGQIQL
jgi:diaminopimelate epimerase